MTTRLLPLLILLFCHSTIASDKTLDVGQSSSTIQFFTHSSENYTFRDEKGILRGKKQGGRRAFLVALVNKMMEYQNHPLNTENTPLKRGIKALQTQSMTALFNLAFRNVRAAHYKWVGPIQVDTVYLYTRNGKAQDFQTLESAKNADGVCVYQGNSTQNLLKQQGFNNVITAPSYESCIRMVAAGRVDLTAHGSSTVQNTIKASKVPPNSIVKSGVSLWTSYGYLAFSKDVPNPIINAWQATLDQIKQSGEYDSLRQQYVLPLE